MGEFKTKGCSRAENIRVLRQLTEREKEAALTAWKHVEKEYTLFGRLVFKDLFNDYPLFKSFFAELLGEGVDPFYNPKFQRHMLQVLMPTMGGMLSNLDHPDAVYEALKRLGVDHKKKDVGIRRENVDTLGASMLLTMKKNIRNYTVEQETVLEKIFLVMMDIFTNALEGKIN